MAIATAPFLLPRANARDIHGCWHLPEGAAKGTLLFLHGYKGYMDWGAWQPTAACFAQAGWRFLRINFTHNGTHPEHPSAFVDLPAFGANTHRKELDETLAVLMALREPAPAGLPNDTATGPLGIIGHSRGGGIACLAAREACVRLEQMGLEGVTHLITWAAVADFESRFPQGAALESWKESGTLEVINHRTRQRLHHDWNFWVDFQAHRDRLHIESAVREFPGRCLVAHAQDDAAVDASHAQQLATWARQATLFLIEQGGHTFGAKEPWTLPHLPEELDVLNQTTLRFLEEGRADG